MDTTTLKLKLIESAMACEDVAQAILHEEATR